MSESYDCIRLASVRMLRQEVIDARDELDHGSIRAAKLLLDSAERRANELYAELACVANNGDRLTVVNERRVV